MDVTLKDIEAAAAELARHIVRTPTKPWLDGSGASPTLSLKLESLQLGGSFKIRGALLNAIAELEKPGVKGLSAVSAGNHGIAVALAARILRVGATVVLPIDNTNSYRIDMCRSLGAEVILAPNRAEAFTMVERVTQERGLGFIPPFDSVRTIIATATLGLEILSDMPGAAPLIFAGVGGGGLAAGLALAANLSGSGAKVVGVEPLTAATMTRSLAAGKPLHDTAVMSVADGLTPPFVGTHCFAVCQKHLHTMMAITDDAILDATRATVLTQRLLVEPSGACAVAGAKTFDSKQTGPRVAVISGGNIAPTALAALIGA